jgi:hypothetical protein
MYTSGVRGVAGAFREALDAPSTAVPFNSTTGRALLVSEHCISATFWMSVQHLATQKTQSYCGIATAAVALNTLALPAAPVDAAYDPYAYWTQDNFFNNCTDEVLSAYSVLHMGSTLQELALMLRCHNISALGYHSNETSGEDFRKYLVYTMANNHIIAANFHRTEVGEVGGGHWSPVVAYNPSVDMVLLAGKPVNIMILVCVCLFAVY